MKRSIILIVLVTTVAALAVAAGVSAKKHTLATTSSNSKAPPVSNLPSFPSKALSPDSGYKVLPVDPSHVEPLPQARARDGETPSPLKQKMADLAARMRVALTRGEDVTALRAEMDALSMQLNFPKAGTKGPVALPKKHNEKLQGTAANQFSTAVTQEKANAIPPETDPLHVQVHELEQRAEEMQRAGQDISGIKARLNVLYEQVLPLEQPKGPTAPPPSEPQLPKSGDRPPTSGFLYAVKDAPASALGAIQRFWEPGDPIGIQIEELDRQAAEIEKNSGDVKEIKARINALYEKLPGYKRNINRSPVPAPVPGEIPDFGPQNRDQHSEPARIEDPYDPHGAEIKNLIRQKKEAELDGADASDVDRRLIALGRRGREGTLDDNGGVLFYSTHTHVSIPDDDPVGAKDSIQVANIGSAIQNVEVTIDSLRHTFDHDLTIYLIGPNALTRALSLQYGASEDDYIGTIFSDTAATPIGSGSAPFTGSFRPDQTLSAFDGSNPNGWWKLWVVDNARDDVGWIGGWHLQIRAPMLNDSCNGAILISVPSLVSGNTCSYLDNYDYACPWNSTSRDAIYSYTPPSNKQISFSLCRSSYDTKLYIYDGICSGIPLACNDDADPCPGATGSYRSYLPCVSLQGSHTYYIVVDGYNGACGNFILETWECAPCDITCQPGDVIECAEVFDTTLATVDCDGGCWNTLYGGTVSFGTLACGQTVCGKSFTYRRSDGSFRDADQYRFTTTQYSNVTMTATAEFPYRVNILDTSSTNCSTTHIYAYLLNVPACSTASLTAYGLPPGTYVAALAPEHLYGIPIPADYRMTLSCTLSPQGQLCDRPYEFTDDTVFVGHTTCGYVDDYDNSCLDRFSGGEDVIYKWHVTQEGNYTIWLNPYSTDWTGIALDNVCPPSASGCIASSTEDVAVPHGIVGQHLTPGTYYIMVDTYPAPDCIPRYDLLVGRYFNCISCAPADSVECAETADSMHVYNDCNGGCNNRDGIPRYSTIHQGDTVCGKMFTYVRGDSVFQDLDWYRFSTYEYDTLYLWEDSPFHRSEGVYTFINGCDSLRFHAGGFSGGFETCWAGWFAASPLPPGDHVLLFGTDYTAMPTMWTQILPTPTTYRLLLRTPAMIQGQYCGTGQLVYGEDTLTNQTTCGFYHLFGETCLETYDGGLQKFYQWTIAQEGDYTVWMDPGTTAWTGFVLDDHCPPDTNNCIAISVSPTAEPHGILCQHLTPGVYYLMVSTWPAPDCIPNYTLYFKRCCVNCQQGDIAECPEHQLPANASTDCDGGCMNHLYGGVNQFGTISCGQTVCGRGFTYLYNSQTHARDADWYLFTVTERRLVHIEATADFPVATGFVDTSICLYVFPWDSAGVCAPAAVDTCLNAGTYALWIAPQTYTGVDIPGLYRVTLQCTPCYVPGENCASAIHIYETGNLTNQTTCGLGHDYEESCMGLYSAGEDIIYRWTVARESNYTLWLNPYDTGWTGILLDDHCPPDTTNCIAWHTSGAAFSHGIACQHMVPGTYYIMVDTWPAPDCIPQFDLSVTEQTPPANDFCANATLIAVPSTTYGTTKCATLDTIPNCPDSIAAPGVWYRIVGTGNTITASLCSTATAWDSRLSVFTCGCDSLHCDAGNDDYCGEFSHAQLSWCSRNGEVYWLLVHARFNSMGDFRLDVSDNGIACVNPARCPCWDAILTAPGTYSGSTQGAGNDCSLRSSPDVELRVLIPSAGRWKFNMCGSLYDTYLFLGTDCCISDVGYDDDATCNNAWTLNSVLCVGLPVAGIYYATIEGWTAASMGDFTLSVTSGAGTPPGQATGLTASTTFCDSIVLSWMAAAGAEGYWVVYDTTQGFYLTTPVTQYVFTSLNPGVHYFSLQGYNQCGFGLYSTPAFGEQRAGPAPIIGMSATDSVCNRTEIHWTDVMDEMGYRVYRNGVQIGSDLPANTVVFYDSVGTVDFAYSYAVAAFNSYCEGDWSAPDSGMQRIAPPQVTGVTATDTLCDYVHITWSDVTAETGYVVLRDDTALGLALPANTVSYDDWQGITGVRYAYTVKALGSFCDALPSAADSGGRPPTPPQVTGVSASDTLCDRVIISWVDLPNETGYRVSRDGTSIGPVLAANVTSYTDSLVLDENRYAYAVRCDVGLCVGPASVVDSGAKIVTPSAVITCTATESRCDSIVVTWSDVANETGYRVLRNGMNVSGNLPANTTRFADGNAVVNYAYGYSVVSFRLNCEAPPSGTDQGLRLNGLPAATGVIVSDTLCSGVRVVWNNNVTGEDSFQIQRNGVRIGSTAANDTVYLDTTAIPWTTYAYRVITFNACGAGEASATDQGTRWAVPSPPANFVASDSTSCGRVLLTWSLVAVPCQYRILRDSVVIGNVPSGVSSFQDSLCVPGVHTYCVQAYNNCGFSAPVCNPGSCRYPPNQTPVLIFPDTCTAIQLCWTNVANEDGYRIYRNSVLLDSTVANITCLTMVTPPGTQVCYTVQAFNVCGLGPMSVPLCITLPRTPPAVIIYPIDSCHIAFCWTDVANETRYIILRNGAAVDSVAANTTCYSDLLTTSGTYVMNVRAVNACGSGPLSNPLTFILPHVPHIAHCEASDTLCAGVHFTWGRTPGIAADSFEILRDGARLVMTNGTVTSYTDVATVPFAVHNYTVIPHNVCGTGPSCNDSGSTYSPPPQVTGVAATQNRCDSIIVTWQDSLHETGYRVYRDGVYIALLAANVTRYADTGQVATFYHYEVAGSNSCGVGPHSDEHDGLRLGAPHSPNSVSASENLCEMIRVTWSRVSGDVDSLFVYRNGAHVASRAPADTQWVDAPIISRYDYTVRAFSNECGLAASAAHDSGTGYSQALNIASFVFVQPPVCDSVRLTWTEGNGDVTAYILQRDSIAIDTVPFLHYTDHNVAPGRHYQYTVRGYNPYCGASAIPSNVNGWSRELLVIGTISDTVRTDTLCVDVNACAGMDSIAVWLSLSSGAYQRVSSWRPNPTSLCVHRQDTLLGSRAASLMFIAHRGVFSDTTYSANFVWWRPTSGVHSLLSEIPTDYFLDQNYPNPFNPTTTIRFGLPRTAEVTLNIFDITGRRVATLLSGTLPPGVHSITWDCSACPSGMYLIRMQAGDRVMLKKMLLMK